MREDLVFVPMRELNDLIDQRVQTKLEEYTSSMAQQKEDKKYYDRKELAQKLNRSVGTIDRWVKMGYIKKEKFGRKTLFDFDLIVKSTTETNSIDKTHISNDVCMFFLHYHNKYGKDIKFIVDKNTTASYGEGKYIMIVKDVDGYDTLLEIFSLEE